MQLHNRKRACNQCNFCSVTRIGVFFDFTILVLFSFV